MSHSKSEVTAIVLAGGQSRRFGSDKSLLQIEGVSVIERIVKGCHTIADEILVISNAPAKFVAIPGITELCDIHPGCGPMGGVHTGLHHMAGGVGFVVACDMPFFSVVLAQRLLQVLDGHDIAIPRDGEGLHPLFGAYRKSVLPCIETMLQQQSLSMRHLCQRLNTRVLPREAWPEDMAHADPLRNINFPWDIPT